MGRDGAVRGGIVGVACWLLAAGCWLLPVGAITPLLSQAELLPTTGANFDAAGRSVAISGDGATALVASPNNNGARGRVTVFVRVGMVWSQQTHLLASDASAGDAFGSGVALSADGNTALIGAPYKTSSSGAAYVFTRSGATWTQSGILTAPMIAADERFGTAVALAADGTTAAVGIPRRGAGSVAQAGAVQLFTRSGGTYTAAGAALTLADAGAYDTLGTALALSADGGVLVAGVEARANNTGAAYVFTRGGGGAYTTRPLAPPAPIAYAAFGRSVAVSNDGGTVLVGEPNRTINGRTNAGAAHQFNRGEGGAYGFVTTLVAPDGGDFDLFGSAVAVSGDGSTAVVAAPAHNSNVGAVYVANRVGGAFAIAQTIMGGYAPNNPPIFGAAVALSTTGATAVFGAPGKATNTGAAYVFANPNLPPTVTAIDPTSGPTFGGTPITITGTNFRPGVSVAFDGIATNTTYVSATQVFVMAPMHLTGVVTVTVTNPDGQYVTRPNAFTYVNPAPATVPNRPIPGNPAPLPPPRTPAPTPPDAPAPNPAPMRR